MTLKIHLLPNNYVATVRSADGMTDFKTIQLGEAQARIARDENGKLHIQSILFSKEKFSIESATITAYYLYRSLM